MILLRSYLHTAFRVLRRNKLYTLSNVFGLSAALCACLFITVFVRNELNYDGFHSDGDRLFYLDGTVEYGEGMHLKMSSFTPLKESLKELDHLIEAQVRVRDLDDAVVKVDHVPTDQFKVGYVDDTFFQVFNFPLVAGNVQRPFDGSSSVVIDTEVAQMLFKNGLALGRSLELNGDEYIVSAVIEKMPGNTLFDMHILLPFEAYLSSKADRDKWELFGDHSDHYFKLKSPEVAADVEVQIAEIINKNQQGDFVYETSLYEVGELYMTMPSMTQGKVFKTNYADLKILVVIGVMILIMAIANYINLSTSKALTRVKEVGIRKVSGAYSRNIRFQHLGESFILVFVSILLAVVMFEVLLTSFNQLVDTAIDHTVLFDETILAGVVLLWMVTALLAGYYPAFFLSRFNPISILKGQSLGGHKTHLRNLLIVFQLVITACLIFMTTVIDSQLNYVRNADLGFDKEHVLNVGAITTAAPSSEDPLLRHYETIKNDFAGLGGVQAVTASPLPGVAYYSLLEWPEDSPNVGENAYVLPVDYDFFNFYDLDFVAGRAFESDNAGDDQVFIVNQTAADKWFGGDAIGKYVGGEKRGNRVIGVVEDFHFQGLKNDIAPVCIQLQQERVWGVQLRLQSDDLVATMSDIHAVWSRHFPDHPFNYKFLDDQFNATFEKEYKIATLSGLFTLIAVILSCLGLIGLAGFMVQKQAKTISIRKIFGSTSLQTITGFLRVFFGLAILAMALSFTASYFLMN